eukprot:500944-Rhodomonas_salina.1
MAESIMNDQTVLQHSLRAALSVLHRHNLTSVSALVLPDGWFRQFHYLPGPLLADVAWKPHLYDAI